jgi:uncharacterized protein (DUF488 family)
MEYSISTIGYEGSSSADFLSALTRSGIQVVVDVRAVANSRRPGFSKKSLAAGLEAEGIRYVHLRGLGTPSSGRAAARAGRHDEMRRIFAEHLATPSAQQDLQGTAEIVESGASACLLCYERLPEHCHRLQVAEALQRLLPLTVRHLYVDPPAAARMSE